MSIRHRGLRQQDSEVYHLHYDQWYAHINLEYPRRTIELERHMCELLDDDETVAVPGELL